ncbi:S-4TM family putative pore-forming effector [Shewanella sp. 3B26]|uniref:S-4TM family putative pore-forming effector n=1 Tax=Shewanella zhuhaiensis TaxID=2919576 RepID=A0AAJ1BJZ4_9GAMM|nr:S-4TM family putative pore-forming effector [Shewanella zhuhaiensis]MCH4296130.1 S-4TM family putative pore-forming effector [Shewanella zhuhaiensis]
MEPIFLNMGNEMTCVIANQKKPSSVEAGLAFRYAYDKAKVWKSWIWALALILAVVQTGVSIYIFSGQKVPFDPAYLTAAPLLAFVLINTLGKYFVSKWQSLGCTLQRLHDFLTMDVGTKPSFMELPKSLVAQLSAKQEKQSPEDRRVLETWWSSNLVEVPNPVAKLIATYSTFAWESELRKRYQYMLWACLGFCVFAPVLISMVLGHTIMQFVVFVLGPFTPIIAVMIDELLMNKQSSEIAHQLTHDCYNTWTNLLANKINLGELEHSTEQHMRYWQNFRQSATPIFEWLYKISRKRMENNMLVNTNELIVEYNKR